MAGSVTFLLRSGADRRLFSLPMMTVAALAFGVPAIARAQRPASASASPATTGGDAATTSESASSATPGALEGDIIVTAQRREESLQRVPLSINAFSGKQLQQLQIRRSVDVGFITPGVNITASAGGLEQNFAIRGVTQNDSSPQQEGPIAVYADDVYISSLQGQNFAFFDIDRVEVLKGPQGTLFGRNATGGLVHFISRRPSDIFSGFGELTYGRFNEVRFEGGVGGPLAQGLDLRASVLVDRHDPILKNDVGRDYEDGHTYAGRLQLRYRPTADVDLLLIGRYGRFNQAPGAGLQYDVSLATVDELGNVTQGQIVGKDQSVPAQITPTGPEGTRPAPGTDFTGYRDPDGPGRRSRMYNNNPFGAAEDRDETVVKTYGATANLKINLSDKVNLTSITDYTKFQWWYSAAITPGGTGSYYITVPGIKQVSEEARLAADLDSLRLIGGIYYLNIDGRFFEGYGYAVPLGGTALGDVGLSFRQRTRSLSGFAQADIDLAPKLTATLGGRYINERKSLTYNASIYSAPDTAILNLRDIDGIHRTVGLWAARTSLNYQASRDTLLYASASRGVKAGGFNAPGGNFATFPLSAIYFKPERLMAYEIGFKTAAAPSGIHFNGAVFYYDYHDFQAYGQEGLNQYVFNADATTYGAELQASGALTGWLEALGGVAYTHARAKDIPAGASNGSTVLGDKDIAFTPRWKLTGLVRYHTLLGAGEFSAQLDAVYSASYFTGIQNFDSYRQEDFAIANANLSYTVHRVTGTIFVRNLTDKRYLGARFELGNVFGGGNAYYNDPRTWGISLRYSW